MSRSKVGKKHPSGANRSGASSSADLKKQAAALETVSNAVMMVDRDFIVTYANQATRQLLSKNAAAFRAIWPQFNPDKILGACIDMFHKNPAHQRQLLSDPSGFRTRPTSISAT